MGMGTVPLGPQAGFGFNPNTGDAFGVGQNQFAPALGGPQAGFGFGYNPNTGDAYGVQPGGGTPVTGGPDQLPSVGMGGGKGGIIGMLPGVIAGQVPQLPGGAQLPGIPPSPIQGQNQTTPFPGQQQPITQGTGQLPPGFGAPSPIDRSQIGLGQLVGGPAGRPIMNPPVNRFVPPMAPGVRPAAAVSRMNTARPGMVTPTATTRTRTR